MFFVKRVRKTAFYSLKNMQLNTPNFFAPVFYIVKTGTRMLSKLEF